MKPAVTFSHVSKCFRLEQMRASSFQERLVNAFRTFGKREQKSFWALRDLSFELDQGQTVGFIGSNGAGKSTALRIAAQILPPTSGAVETSGRIGALLELGAGFHPDLTGRENIFLNGSILGLKRRVIQQRLESIVAFAELEKFIDLPVKYYSSGMYTRLGFAVAAHTDPNILLVDEVLAVGDTAFQQKCLKRIDKLRTQGVTIVIVSHNLANITDLCDRAIWFVEGQVRADGEVSTVTDAYLAFAQAQFYDRSNGDRDQDRAALLSSSNRWGSFQAVIERVELLNARGEVPAYFEAGEQFRLRMHYRAYERIKHPAFGLAIYRSDGAHINGPNSVREGLDIPYIEGTGFVDYIIQRLPLSAGSYELTVAIYNRNSTFAFDHHHRIYTFDVHASSQWSEAGLVHIPAQWEHVGHTSAPLTEQLLPASDTHGEIS